MTATAVLADRRQRFTDGVVMFHPGVLHGGGAGPGRRRSLSLRFFGDDVVYSPRAGRPSPPFPGIASTHRAGQPLRSFWFPKVFPTDEGVRAR